MGKKKNVRDEWQDVINELEYSADNKWEGQLIYELSPSGLESVQTEIDLMIIEAEYELYELEQSVRRWQSKVEQRKLHILVTRELGMENLSLMRYLNEEDDDRRYSPFFAPKKHWNSAKKGIVEIPTLYESIDFGRSHLENCINWSKSLIKEVLLYKSMETDSESEKALVGAIQNDVLPILTAKLEELEKHFKSVQRV